MKLYIPYKHFEDVTAINALRERLDDRFSFDCNFSGARYELLKSYDDIFSIEGSDESYSDAFLLYYIMDFFRESFDEVVESEFVMPLSVE